MTPEQEFLFSKLIEFGIILIAAPLWVIAIVHASQYIEDSRGERL